MLIATAAQIREADHKAIYEIGLPGIVLMENAAQGVARILIEEVCIGTTANIAAFCGRGNNGGDGLAICRILAGRGFSCTAYLFCLEEQILKQDVRINLEIAKACGVKIIEIINHESFMHHLKDMSSYDFYLDALLGTGLNVPVAGLYAKAIDFLNGLNQPILAVDIPSGLCTNTGMPLDKSVHPTITVTFGLMKVGLALQLDNFVGKIRIVDIGIPLDIIQKIGIDCRLLETSQVIGCLNERFLDGHKGRFGHLLAVGGSTGFSGAAFLMAMAGVRAGAGLVTLALPEGLRQVAEIKLTAVMSQPLFQTNEGGLSLRGLARLLALGYQRSALAIGPGLGQAEETKELVRKVLAELTIPVVVDADGLNALVGNFFSLAIAANEIVITPHPGEAARLLNCTIANIQADRLTAARRLAKIVNAVVVLKGPRTVIASPLGAVWISPTGNPLLASGGSGDVLTGLIGGLLAQGLTALESALAGVYIHGLAADLAIEKFGFRGLAAEELLDYLPLAFIHLEKSNKKKQDIFF